MGYLNHLIEEKIAASYLVQAQLPSLSRPLYETILTGTPVRIHGIVSNNTVRLSKMESIFHLARKNNLTTAAASYHWISELYNYAPFDYLTHRMQIKLEKPIQYGHYYFEDSYPNSHLILDGELLRQKYRPDFLLIHPMEVDNVGHLYGGNSKEYREKIMILDSILANFLPLWLEGGYQVVLTADHGMSDDGMHGGISDEERLVPLVILSSKVEAKRYNVTLSQLGIAALICNLLGIKEGEAMHKEKIVGLR